LFRSGRAGAGSPRNGIAAFERVDGVVEEERPVRVDKFLKVSRLIKRRTVAQEACDGGRVSVNGRRAKPGAEVRAGDVVEVSFGNRTLRAEITETRESATVEQAGQMYRILEDNINGISS